MQHYLSTALKWLDKGPLLRLWLLLQPFLALFALGVLSVFLFLPLSIAIMADSPGSPIFLQSRTGKNGKPFTMLKFRSMFAGSSHEEVTDERTDERITRVGRFIRRWKLDELLQLVNVVLLQMNLVGPRPMMQCLYLKRVGEYLRYALRTTILPGLTGFAALYGPECHLAKDYRTQLVLDRYYLMHRSFTFDMVIIFRTIGLISRTALPTRVRRVREEALVLAAE